MKTMASDETRDTKTSKRRERTETRREKTHKMSTARATVTTTFALTWALVLTWGEYVVHDIAQRRCAWPEMENSTRVMVIADPQVVDEFTYATLSKGSVGLAFAEAICDAYIRRAFRAARRRFAPDHFVFLGDLFGHGARGEGDGWDRIRRRVDAAFDWHRDSFELTNLNYHTIPGNHDIGYSEVIRNHPNILERHEKWYGESNYVARLGGVDFIGVNAMVLDGRGEASDATWAFIDSLKREESNYSAPRVLLTHVPLPNLSQQCGANRNSRVITGRLIGRPKEVVYQDYLTQVTAERLLTAVEPDVVLSGHDHDQCQVTHRYQSHGRARDATEITVGTFSALNGNAAPSYLMLTVSDNVDENFKGDRQRSVRYELCYLPDVRRIVKTYVYVAIFCIFAFLGPPFGELIKPFTNDRKTREMIERFRYA